MAGKAPKQGAVGNIERVAGGDIRGRLIEEEDAVQANGPSHAYIDGK